MKKLVYVLILLALLAAACSGPAPQPKPAEQQAPAQPVQTEAPQKTTLPRFVYAAGRLPGKRHHRHHQRIYR